MTNNLFLKLSQNDNVIVALKAVDQNTTLEHSEGSANTHIPAGHKIAIQNIPTGSPILKYGQIIGFASCDIITGDHVHTHNVKFDEYEKDYAIGSNLKETILSNDIPTFMGYKRPSGQYGTRNYIGIISTVNCSATAVQHIAQRLNDIVQKTYPNIDGVVPITHSTGCCSPPGSKGDQNLQRVLGGYCRHPNFCFVIVVGLGCEGMQIARLVHNEGLESETYLRTLSIQETGGIRKTIEEAVNKATDIVDEANQAKREPASISEIKVALQCGGSDSYSGITANPALGCAVDQLVQCGGTAILAETPEIYGAEHLLTQRAQSPEIAQKLLSQIKWWEEYTGKNNSSMDNNPSPGNKAGGLTTILEKSLGAVAKGGSTNLCGVFDYAERITTKGLVFMDSPGYDPASVTGEVAGGANIICFTTGRGSVFGNKPVPSIKLATNSAMYNFMQEDMDINCGEIIEGSATIESKGQEIFNAILHTASGDKTKSEVFGLGDFEFIPWQVGVVM